MTNSSLHTYYFCAVCLAHAPVGSGQSADDQFAGKELVRFSITHSESFEISICLTKTNNQTDASLCLLGSCTNAKPTYGSLGGGPMAVQVNLSLLQRLSSDP